MCWDMIENTLWLVESEQGQCTNPTYFHYNKQPVRTRGPPPAHLFVQDGRASNALTGVVSTQMSRPAKNQSLTADVPTSRDPRLKQPNAFPTQNKSPLPSSYRGGLRRLVLLREDNS
mmetsp:Transcript_1405/g.2281  ORF Transcript_1405/g.2281 Transcript_1405/m.2281 type:complete len:117 (-) Transcript_1405:100-450(-)